MSILLDFCHVVLYGIIERLLQYSFEFDFERESEGEGYGSVFDDFEALEGPPCP